MPTATLLLIFPGLPVVKPNIPLFQPITAFAPLYYDRSTIQGVLQIQFKSCPNIQLSYGIALNDWALSVKIQI
jgi:hypothetical protein